MPLYVVTMEHKSDPGKPKTICYPPKTVSKDSAAKKAREMAKKYFDDPKEEYRIQSIKAVGT